MLKPRGLISGHYECRRLDDTIPVFTDLLAMEVLERKGGEATLKHPNTEWRLVVHEGGPEAPDKGFDNHYDFASAAIRKSKRRGNNSKRTKKNID